MTTFIHKQVSYKLLDVNNKVTHENINENQTAASFERFHIPSYINWQDVNS